MTQDNVRFRMYPRRHTTRVLFYDGRQRLRGTWTVIIVTAKRTEMKFTHRKKTRRRAQQHNYREYEYSWLYYIYYARLLRIP